MTPREFLAVAVMISAYYDVQLMDAAQLCADAARTSWTRGYWQAYRDADALRAGAYMVLWLEAQPA
jgi:hypothetical protein